MVKYIETKTKLLLYLYIMEKRVIENYDIANSNETLHLAQDVAKFIRENRLFHNIQGKAYVNVEGWQYAGARLGILPVVDKLERTDSEGGEYKYQAEVKLLNLRSQQVVGSGFAICSNKEFGKKAYQEFAIASMAQTRAIGKAYRNILAWIIRAAGYEPTPAEEMDYMIKEEPVTTAAPLAANAGAPQEKAKVAKKEKQAAPAEAKKEGAPEKKNASVAEAEEEKKETEAPVKPASVKQKTELLLLLNNKAITGDEKNKMLENINSLDSDRIEKAILKVKKVIEERQESKQQAA